jgi:hypothetical protein
MRRTSVWPMLLHQGPRQITSRARCGNVELRPVVEAAVA